MAGRLSRNAARRGTFSIATAALALTLAAPAGAATRCGVAKVTERTALYTTTLSIPRCWNGNRVWSTGPAKAVATLSLLGIDNRWNLNGVTSVVGPRRYRYRGHTAGELRVVRRFSFLQCLDLGPIGCVLPSGTRTERTTLRAFFDGRISGS